MAAAEAPPDDGSGEYSPRQMLSRAETRSGPEFRAHETSVRMGEISPEQMMIYDEANDNAWLQSSCFINRGNIR